MNVHLQPNMYMQEMHSRAYVLFKSQNCEIRTRMLYNSHWDKFISNKVRIVYQRVKQKLQ